MRGFSGGPWFGGGPVGVEEVVHGWRGGATAGMVEFVFDSEGGGEGSPSEKVHSFIFRPLSSSL